MAAGETNASSTSTTPSMEMSGALRTQAGAEAGPGGAVSATGASARWRFVLVEQRQQVDGSLAVAAGAQCSADRLSFSTSVVAAAGRSVYS